MKLQKKIYKYLHTIKSSYTNRLIPYLIYRNHQVVNFRGESKLQNPSQKCQSNFSILLFLCDPISKYSLRKMKKIKITSSAQNISISAISKISEKIQEISTEYLTESKNGGAKVFA